jgi:hypothetical protein
MLGRTLWEVFPEFAGSQFESACRRAMDAGETVHFEEYCAPLDAWFQHTMYPAADGITVYVRDITERKRMEAALDGASNFSPQTSGFRLLYLVNSIIGTAVTSLTLTYLMQVYNALQRRNKLGLNLELSSAETGDDAELIAGLGPEGKFDAGYSDLSEMAGDVAGAKESHHFYPVLFYFRFNDRSVAT